MQNSCDMSFLWGCSEIHAVTWLEGRTAASHMGVAVSEKQVSNAAWGIVAI